MNVYCNSLLRISVSKLGSVLHFGPFSFVEIMRVGTLQLQAIALSSEHFEEISPIDILLVFGEKGCLPQGLRRWAAIE